MDDTCLKADLYGKQEKNAVGMEIMNSDSTIKSATKRVSQWSNVINPKRCKKHGNKFYGFDFYGFFTDHISYDFFLQKKVVELIH